MNQKIICALVLLGLAGPVTGQRFEHLRSEQYSGNFEPIHRKLNYDEVEGSPYLEDELIKGYVKLNLGDSTVQFLRYNIYTDEMEYLDGEKLAIIDNPGQIAHVYVNNHTFVYKTYKFRNNFKKGYLEKLVDGHFDLYTKYHVDFEKWKEARSSYEKATPDRFIAKLPTWYFAIDNGPIMNFENNKSGLEEIFRDDYPLIKKYIKDEKLKLRLKEDLIKLFQYYNSIK